MNTKEVARKGYEERSKTKAEYKDDPEVLKEKVKVLAKLLRDSNNCVFYSGAGISTGAGVPDYASKNKPTKKLAGGYRSAEPTMAHHSAKPAKNPVWGSRASIIPTLGYRGVGILGYRRGAG